MADEKQPSNAEIARDLLEWHPTRQTAGGRVQQPHPEDVEVAKVHALLYIGEWLENLTGTMVGIDHELQKINQNMPYEQRQ